MTEEQFDGIVRHTLGNFKHMLLFLRQRHDNQRAVKQPELESNTNGPKLDNRADIKSHTLQITDPMQMHIDDNLAILIFPIDHISLQDAINNNDPLLLQDGQHIVADGIDRGQGH